MDREENRSHFKNTKNRIQLVTFLILLGVSYFSYSTCSSKKREIQTVSFDLTRELSKDSTIKIGSFGEGKDPIPSHWKKNPGRYSSLPTSEKWWNSQITFNTDTNLFINESKDSITIPPSDSKVSSVQFSIPKKKYNLYFSLGVLQNQKFSNCQGNFSIDSGTENLFQFQVDGLKAEQWNLKNLAFLSLGDLKFSWRSKNCFLVLGSPILTEYTNTKSPNIVLIVIDSARKDFFPMYGFPHPITPNLSKLAQDSVVFENPFSNGNWTKPSMISFFHSEYSSNLGIHNLWFATLPNHKKIYYKKNSPSLTEILRSYSYFTETIMNNVFLLDYTTVGVDLSFHSSYQVGKDIEDSEILTNESLDFLQNRKDQLFFLHWNLNTPHGGYAPPASMMDEVRNIIPSEELNAFETPIRRYIGELYYTDYLIGKFIQKLKELNLYEDTVILVTGDHGELFDKKHDYHFRYILQGLYGHGETHYDEEINVPYILKPSHTLNGIRSKEKVPGQQSLLSILPTLLGLANIEQDTSLRKGNDYSNCIISTVECPEEKFIYTEGRMSESLRTPDYKYIRRYQGYTNVSLTLEGERHSMPEELYNLKKDPKEYKNLATTVEGKILLNQARRDFASRQYLNKNQFVLYLPECGSKDSEYRIFLNIPAGIYRLELPTGFLATNDQLRNTTISGKRSEQSNLIRIQTVNPEPTVFANITCNGKTMSYRMGKWGILNHSSQLAQENSFMLSGREPNGFRKSNLPWIYNDGRLSGEYESESEALMGQEVRKILESWGYIHE